MSASFKMHSILSVRERESLRRRIDEKRREMQGEIIVPRHPKGTEEGYSERRMGRYAQFIDKNVGVDKELIKRQITRLEKVLSDGSPDSLSRAKKVALEKQVQADREFLKKAMCPKDLYFVKYKDPNFEKAKKACSREHQKDFQTVANRYKNSMRQIDPENPDAANVERLRPDHA